MNHVVQDGLATFACAGLGLRGRVFMITVAGLAGAWLNSGMMSEMLILISFLLSSDCWLWLVLQRNGFGVLTL